ncbi:MAG: hypothetical protein TR69_WS6001000877 [candidate division WS6 bacterium OLB20]|uniref:Uncharacterized protein n=1 Tax=candidate division WS6 bacterium OLB20 TaxID=1617426 RepID=A0A136LZ20_9BACT|nr:MAG: hypothetical protein TR69_WS6001000877 [candidate division WS6 bacterium OLB20]
MDLLKRLLHNKKPQRTKTNTPARGDVPVYPSNDEMKHVISESIRQIGPVLKKLSNG